MVLKSNYISRENLLKVFVVSCLVAAVYGVYQSQTGIDLFRNVTFKPTPLGSLEIWRSKGFFSSVMTYANSMGLAFCFLFGFQFIGKGFKTKNWRIICYITLVALALAILTSLTRGLWLGVFAGLFVMATLKRRGTRYCCNSCYSFVGYYSLQ